MNIELIDIYELGLEAEQVLYTLLKERSIENDPNVNISHRGLPSWEDHLAFVRSKPYHAWYLIQVEDEGFAGYVSLTKRNEIGIILFAAYRGRSIGKLAVRMLMEKVPPQPGIPSERPGQYVANINPRNKRSLGLFNDLGFRPVQVTLSKSST